MRRVTFTELQHGNPYKEVLHNSNKIDGMFNDNIDNCMIVMVIGE